MADTFDIHMVSSNVGALSNADTPICKIPSGGGGITVLGAEYTPHGAGTSYVQLLDLGTSGTVNSGTIATFGTVVGVSTVPNAGTLVTPFVAAGHYIGVKEANVGAMATVSIVSFSFVMGK